MRLREARAAERERKELAADRGMGPYLLLRENSSSALPILSIPLEVQSLACDASSNLPTLSDTELRENRSQAGIQVARSRRITLLVGKPVDSGIQVVLS